MRAQDVVKRKWTRAELAVLRARYPHERTADLARDMGRTTGQVYNAAFLHGLKKTAEFLSSPAACRLISDVGKRFRFKPGHKTWNAGMKGWQAGGRSRETRFRKGHRHGMSLHNYVVIGTERVMTDGLLYRKLSDAPKTTARRWLPVHRIVWENENGAIPEGMVVVFRPGMHTNRVQEITLDRVECITRAENMRRNSYHKLPTPLPQLIQLRGVLNRKINRKTNHEKQDAGST